MSPRFTGFVAGAQELRAAVQDDLKKDTPAQATRSDYRTNLGGNSMLKEQEQEQFGSFGTTPPMRPLLPDAVPADSRKNVDQDEEKESFELERGFFRKASDSLGKLKSRVPYVAKSSSKERIEDPVKKNARIAEERKKAEQKIAKAKTKKTEAAKRARTRKKQAEKKELAQKQSREIVAAIGHGATSAKPSQLTPSAAYHNL